MVVYDEWLVRVVTAVSWEQRISVRSPSEL